MQYIKSRDNSGAIFFPSQIRCGGYLVFGALVLTGGWSRADGNDPVAPSSDAQQAAYRGSVAQESIRQQSSQVRDDLLQLISELKLNDMSGSDIVLLTQASTRLSSLNQDDMQQVITALQSASMTQGDQQQRDALAGAYQGQKSVSLKLKSLASELNAQQVQNELPAQLQVLIARQSANIRKTAVLRDSGHAPDQLNPEQKTLHTMVSSEQTAISGEIDILFKVVTATAGGQANDPATSIGKTALEAMTGSMLQSVIPLAAQFTKAGPFPEAVAKQASVRDYLIGVMLQLVSKDDTATRLDQVRTQLDQIQEDQKDLATATTQSTLDAATLAERQNKIADLTDVTQALLKSLNRPAADRMAEAQKDMEQAATGLQTAKSPSETAPQQKQVAQALDDVSKLLDQQIAAMENQQDKSPTDQLADLQNLQNQLKQVQQTDKTDAPTAAKDLEKIQQDNAGQLSTDVAKNIADATDKLDTKQPDADGANKDLTDATNALQKQADAMQKAAQDYQALQNADKLLADAEQNATAADQNIQANKDGNLTSAAKALSQAQNDVGQAAQNPPANVPGDAKQAMQAAADALKDATNNAVQAKGGPADASTQKGLAAIKQARQSLGQAMADAQQQNSQSHQSLAESKAKGALHGKRTSVDQKIAGGGPSGGGPGQVIGALQPKDRDALKQYQAEKIAPDYAPQVEQYLKNLADYGAKQ